MFFRSIAIAILSAATLAQDNQVDCEKVKETCSRKTGCKCVRECNGQGERMPARGGKAECVAYCCESKCQCHPACP